MIRKISISFYLLGFVGSTLVSFGYLLLVCWDLLNRQVIVVNNLRVVVVTMVFIKIFAHLISIWLRE